MPSAHSPANERVRLIVIVVITAILVALFTVRHLLHNRRGEHVAHPQSVGAVLSQRALSSSTSTLSYCDGFAWHAVDARGCGSIHADGQARIVNAAG